MTEDLSIDAIARFASIVSAGSLSAASRAEGVSKATFSRALNALEAELGVSLLDRRASGVVPTAAGRALLDRALPALAELRRARDDVRRASASKSGALRVASPPELAHGWLGPRLERFLASDPELSIEVQYGARVVDLAHEGFDLAIRAGRVEDTAVRSRVLGRMSTVLVASPTCLARDGVPRRLDDLTRASCLALAVGPPGQRWELMDAGGRVHVVHVEGRFASNDLAALRTAALAGLGIARLPDWMVDADLARGLLVSVLPELRAPERTYYVVVPAGRLPARVRALVDALVQGSRR